MDQYEKYAKKGVDVADDHSMWNSEYPMNEGRYELEKNFGMGSILLRKYHSRKLDPYSCALFHEKLEGMCYIANPGSWKCMTEHSNEYTRQIIISRKPEYRTIYELPGSIR